ncbi:hypothetical protein M3Y94_00969700 [Aphelenchoides besseyi]|nr:hypothetical protein M3Y94_00969700 [Aphelenchoides besseyi]KAI6224632.1 hypothetical protein M3Y95_00773300 [Aphelenchoides besseyi]
MNGDLYSTVPSEFPFYSRIQHSHLPDELGGTFFDDELVIVREKREDNYEVEKLDGQRLSVPSDSLGQSLQISSHGYTEPLRISVAPFDGSSTPGDLSFGIYQIVAVVENIDGAWARGQIVGDNGKTLGTAGLFPLNFTVQLPSLDSSNGSVNNLEVVKSEDENKETASYPHCRALYDFNAEYSGELKFTEGQVISLLNKCNADWFEGEVEDPVDGSTRRGVFPSNHVEIVVDLDDDSKQGAASDAEIQSIRYGSVDVGEEPQTIGYATVLYDFTARYPDEMNAEAGFSVRILQVDGEWANCFNPVDGSRGFIPVGFLQMFLDEDDDENGMTNGAVSTPNDFTQSNWWPETPNERAFYDQAWRQQPIYDSVPALLEQVNGENDSGNASLASGASSVVSQSLSIDEQPAVSNQGDDQFNELFGLTPQQTPVPSTSAAPSTSKAPMRPPAPKTRPTPRSNELIFQAAVDPFTIKSNGGPSTSGSLTSSGSWQQQFAKVVEELLNSEIAYSMELNAWETCIRDSPSLDQQRKCVLVNGFPLLKDLSQRLIRSIAEQMDKPPERQCYGQLFMEMRDRINKAFAYYFRCIEEITQIIENKKDVALQQSLQECLTQMRQLGVFVFDVTTAISRPIIRSLKYPLFISELSKILPLTHIDHPKLLEANKQMGSLVTKMNESKRRKELMVKYREDRNTSIIDRLSRVNMHSFQKKSNRLKYRIAASMGLTNNPDPEFTAMVQELDSAERRLCKFLYNVQVYKTRVSFMVKKYVNTHIVDSKKVQTSSNEPLKYEFNSYLKRLEPMLKDFRSSLHHEIVLPCQQLQKSEYAKLIEKRCDKLADYDIARINKKSADEIEKCRCEFEALNTHVKNNLPKIWCMINERVYSMAKVVCDRDDEFFQKINKHLFELPTQLRVFPLVDFNEFADPNSVRLIGFHKQIQRVDGQPTEKMKSVRSSLRKTLRIPETRGTRMTPIFSSIAPRAQTLKERDALIKIFRAENRTPDLRRVKADYVTPRIMLRKNDVVVVLKFQNGFCTCENGVGTDRIPLHILGPFDDFYASAPETPSNQVPLIPMDLVSSTITTSTNGSKPVLTKQQSQNLIDLSSSTPSTPRNTEVPPLELLDYDREPQSPANKPNSWVTFSPKPQIDDKDPFAELFQTTLAATVDPAQTSVRSPRFRAESPPEIPTRAQLNRTPLPAPVDNYSSVPSTARSTTSDSTPVLPMRPQQSTSVQPIRVAPPPPKRPTSLEVTDGPKTYVCEYDFSPISNDQNQLKVRENQRVHVIQPHDEAGNPEWFLCSDIQTPKLRGYVPSAYLRPETA